MPERPFPVIYSSDVERSVRFDQRPAMFVYLDEAVAQLRAVDGRVLKEPEDMFWGERVADVADPDGNPVALAMAPDRPSAPAPRATG